MALNSMGFGLILAAGRGRRMGPSLDQPKCLNEVNGQTLISMQISAMRYLNVSKIIVVTGYQRILVAPYGDIEIFNSEWESSNMVYSLLKAGPIVRNSGCTISYGDIFYDEKTLSLLHEHEHDHEIYVLYSDNWKELWKKRSDNPIDDAESFQLNCDGTIKIIGTKPITLDEIEGQYMGVVRFTKSGWNTFESFALSLPHKQLETISMTNLLNLMIAQKVSTIKGILYSGDWGEIDTESDLDLFNNQ